MSQKPTTDSGNIPKRRVEKKPRLQPNSEERPRVRLSQKMIVATAVDLFARQGFGATSLDDIGAALGVTKGALYYHVKNKEEILKLTFDMVLAISEEPLRRIAEADLSAVEKLRRAVANHVAISANRSPSMQVFYREESYLTGPFAREIIERKKDYERLFESLIVEGMSQGVFRADIDSKIATFAILGMCNWLSQWYKPGGLYTPEQVADFFFRILETGFMVNTPALVK